MTYQVLVVRYGTRTTVKSDVYLNYGVYHDVDADIEMDYFFWVITGADRTILVDCGFSPEGARRRSRTMLHRPVDVLAELGIAAEDISTIIVTHAHYDHIGNLPDFPNAEIVISQPEYDFATGPLVGRAQFAHSHETEELHHLASLGAAGSLTLFEDTHTVAPGVTLTRVGGHTPGQVIVRVDTTIGPVLLASDSLHYYEELERDRPFAVVADLPEMYRAFDLLQELSSECTIIAGHDPRVRELFPAHAVLGDDVVTIGEPA